MSIICKNCGKELSDNARFCNNCGVAIEEVVGGEEIKMTAEDVYRTPETEDTLSVDHITEDGVETQTVNVTPADETTIPVETEILPEAVGEVAKPQKTKRLKPNAGMVIGSVCLAILATVFLLAFIVLTVTKDALKEDTVEAFVQEVDVAEVKVGGLSEVFGKNVDDDDTLSEALYAANEDLLENLDISERDLAKVLNSEEIKEQISAKIGEGMDSVLSGDAYTITKDELLDMIEDNQDVMEDYGITITDENLDQISAKLHESKLDTITIGISGLTSATSDDNDKNDDSIAVTVIKALRSDVTRFALLGLAVVLYILILVINGKVIYAGLRTVGISAMIAGLITTAGVLLASPIVGGLKNLPVSADLIRILTGTVRDIALPVTLPVLGAGLLFLVVSIIVQLVAFRPKEQEENG